MPNRYQPERRYSSPLANGEAIPNRAPIRLFAPPASPPPSAAVAASAGLTLTTCALLGRAAPATQLTSPASRRRNQCLEEV